MSLHPLLGQARAHHVDAVEGGLDVHLLLVDFKIESVLPDLELEMLTDLVLVEDPADPDSDLVAAVETAPLNPLADLPQLSANRFNMTLVERQALDYEPGILCTVDAGLGWSRFSST